MNKEQRDLKWLRTNLIITKQENQAMYLCMERRSYAEVGKIMGVSRGRVLQLINSHKWHSKKESQVHSPRRDEIYELLPQIDFIKSIYEN
jgi:DNA-binding CsgD family transcriptional regulator